MSVIHQLKSLYQVDSYQWLTETIKLLKSNCLDQLDLEHLIEELEDLGCSEKNAVESLVEQIIRHLLLLQYWEQESLTNLSHWRAEITGFRTQLKRKVTTTLRNHLDQQLPYLYQDALAYVKQKTSFQVDFPDQPIYSLTELEDLNFF